MRFTMTSNDYVEYLLLAADKIKENGDYISGLDAITGDGDHWANINMGFEHIVAESEDLRQKPIWYVLKKTGMIMMSKVGGSSGILYGGAYLAAGKAVAEKDELSCEDLCVVLNTMVNDMMERGKAKPGFKTMIDSLYPAAEAYKKCLEDGVPDDVLLDTVKQAAIDGAEATKQMEAVKGRASYQQNKGVGHLDPGAVTMSYQISCLCDYIKTMILPVS